LLQKTHEDLRAMVSDRATPLDAAEKSAARGRVLLSTEILEARML
jgi:hypothetical protein